MEFDLDLMKLLFPAKKPKPKHLMKWGYPEARFTAAVDDVEKKIPKIKKLAKFAGGGEFIEEIHAKDYGQGIFAYFIVRTDKKTEQETVFSDAYMLREEDKLGFDVQQAFKISQDFDQMGYRHVFDREIMVWSFRSVLRVVNAFDVADFGQFVEVGLPATKMASVREIDEKWVYSFYEKIGIKRPDVIPTDLITLELATIMEEENAGANPQAQTGANKMGFGGGKGNLF